MMGVMSVVHLFLYTSVTCIHAVSFVTSKDTDTINPTGWSLTEVSEVSKLVDPTGWNYDRETKSPLRDYKKEDIMVFCNNLLNNKNTENVLISQQSNIVFVRRFINILLESAGLPDKYKINKEDISGIIEVKLTRKHYETLTRFSESRENISFNELDAVLSNSIHRRYEPPFKVEDMIENIFFIICRKEFWLPILLGSLALILLRMVATSKTGFGVISSLILVIFVAAYAKEYHRMYKEAEIQQRITLEKHKDIPHSCLAENQPWYNGLYNAVISLVSFNKDDECKKYYKAILLDPLDEVSPVKVLASILADFILHPASKVGQAISAFSEAILRELPFQYGLIVLAASSVGVIVILCLSLMLLAGGSFHLRSLFGGISISSERNPQITSSRSAPQLTANATSIPPQLMTAPSGTGNYVLLEANLLKMLINSGPSDRIEELNPKLSVPEISPAEEKTDLTKLSPGASKQIEKENAEKSVPIINLGSFNKDLLAKVLEKCNTAQLNCSTSDSVISSTTPEVCLNNSLINDSDPKWKKEMSEAELVTEKPEEKIDTSEID